MTTELEVQPEVLPPVAEQLLIDLAKMRAHSEAIRNAFAAVSHERRNKVKHTEKEQPMTDRKYKYEVGQHVIYVDPLGTPRDALVTVWWGDVRTCGDIVDESGCNVAFVEGDAAKKDANGRQVSHAASVVHRSKKAAHGHYWCWDYELDVGQKSMLNTDHR